MEQVEMKYRTEIKSRHSLSRSRSSAERCYPIFRTLQNPASLAFPSWGVWSWWDVDCCSSAHHTQGIKRPSQLTGWLCCPIPRREWCEDREVKDAPLRHLDLNFHILGADWGRQHHMALQAIILLLLKGLQWGFCGHSFWLKNTNLLGTCWIKAQYILAWSTRHSIQILSPQLPSGFCHLNFVCAVLLSSTEFSSWILHIQHSTGKNEDFKPSWS